ncbi:MAG: hypothetical protein GXX91_00100 [Verrucomicrobiaceae bacterium]|nr:hypothetical protein [Verrucomicrobiaceae bacterium]
MNHRPSPLAILFLALAAMVFPNLPPAHAQEEGSAPAAATSAAEKEKSHSIMADPRLRNMLRSVKEDPAAALEEAVADPSAIDTSDLDPEEAVRQMTKAFADNKDKIDPDKLKAAVATVQESGLVEKTAAAVEQLAPEAAAVLETVPEAAGVAAMLKESPESAPESVASEPKPAPEPVPADVPATRPAPGISGGVPTPVAMPVDPGEMIATPVDPDAPPPGADEPLRTAADSPALANTAVDAIAGATPTQPMIPDSPGLTPEEIPKPQPLTKKYAAGGGAYPAADSQHMEILSKESTMDNARGILLFTGNVFIDHPEFEIKCDKLEIQMAKGVGMDGSAAGESDATFKRAIASGGMVEIKRIAPDEEGKPKTQIAIARIADYNAITKDIILSGGPPYIQDGDSFVKTNSEDAQIIMRGNGLYEITGSNKRSQIVIPVEQEEGKNGKKGENGIGLGNAFDGFR